MKRRIRRVRGISNYVNIDPPEVRAPRCAHVTAIPGYMIPGCIIPSYDLIPNAGVPTGTFSGSGL